jgi:hypothetical protein
MFVFIRYAERIRIAGADGYEHWVEALTLTILHLV